MCAYIVCVCVHAWVWVHVYGCLCPSMCVHACVCVCVCVWIRRVGNGNAWILSSRLSSELCSKWSGLLCNFFFFLSLFAFRYVDPHKNPAPFFSSLFRNVRNNGVLCVLVPDTMHFARSPHVVRRCYGANCIKTEYLKELAVRIILAALAT